MRQALVLLLLCVVAVYSANPKFQFDENGKFKVLWLTDFHYGDSDFRDLMTESLQTFLLERSQPDLAIISGDLVSGYAWDGKSQEFYQDAWEKYTRPFNMCNIPYAQAFGNHDDGANYNRTQIIELDISNPLRSPEGVTPGTNYYVPIFSSQDENQAKVIFWFLDTHDRGCLNVTDTGGCEDETQIRWFKQEFEKLQDQYGKDVTHILVTHIPMPEFVTMYNTEPIYGHKGEGSRLYNYFKGVSCPAVNNQVFQLIKERGFKASFSGHNHCNDFGGFYQNVELVYGIKTGYGSYGKLLKINKCIGPDGYLGIQRGARQVFFTEEVQENGQTVVKMEHNILQMNGEIRENGPLYRRADHMSDC